MRSKIQVLVLVILGACFFYKACTRDSSMLPEIPRVNPIFSILPVGSWQVSKLIHTHKDMTRQFKGDVFRFLRDGTVTVYTGPTSERGKWTLGANDDPDLLTLDFGRESKFTILNGGWGITRYDRFLIFTEQAPGSGSPPANILNFEKIRRYPDADPEK